MFFLVVTVMSSGGKISGQLIRKQDMEPPPPALGALLGQAGILLHMCTMLCKNLFELAELGKMLSKFCFHFFLFFFNAHKFVAQKLGEQ